jgi:hypothetical protein
MAKTYNNYNKFETTEKSKILPEKVPAANQVEIKAEPKVELKKENKVETVEKRVLYYCNVRKAPNGEIAKTYQSGTIVKVVKEVEGWSLLDEGLYIRSDLLG